MVRVYTMPLLMLIAGCGSGNNPRVGFVVPEGFTGPIWILFDRGGQDIPLIDGRYRVVVPDEGVMRVRSHRPFERWHQTSARYDDGTSLPQSFLGGPAGRDVVALRGGSSGIAGELGDRKNVRWIQFFVGTGEEYDERPERDLPPAVLVR
jgi:hypothetical protein